MSDRYDYVSPGLVARPDADAHFPNMIEGDPTKVPWPWMREDDPHIWRCHKDMPTAGFINRDEATILYNTARQFWCDPALEIGVLFGWSTWHLAAAGVKLLAVDPLLRHPDTRCRQAIGSLNDFIKSGNEITWCSEASPGALDHRHEKWNLVFIDANHDAPHPMLDAVAAEHQAAADALIMFHDVICPDVFEAVRWLRWKGWKIRIYNTSQIMAAAWRGDVCPVDHVPDPAIDELPLPEHLRDEVFCHV